MNREIKFRAWLKDEKKMIDVRAIDFDDDGNIICVNYPEGKSYSGYDGDNIELMQYTGLKDKNGNEIYEGDIVKGTKRNGTKYWEINFISVVKFTNENKKSKFNIYVNEYKEFDFSACFGLEVIGNIYENKELLENAS